MKLLILNFAMEPNDPALGFTIDWAKEIGSHFSQTTVLTGRASRQAEFSDLLVSDFGWKVGSRTSNIARLASAFLRTLSESRPDVVFVHMAAAYATVVGPICRAWRIPMVLWYEHQANSLTLRVAETWASAVVSASPGYPGRSVPIVVGHGISIEDFGPQGRPRPLSGSQILRAVHAGRADPVKRVDRIVEQIHQARLRFNQELTFTQIGSPMRNDSASGTPQWPAHSWVTYCSTVPRQSLATHLRQHDFFVHAYGGAIDKAPLEASLSGLPVVSEGRYVYEALGGMGKAPSIVRQLGILREFGSNDMDAFVARQQQSVLSNHSLKTTASRIAAVLEQQVSDGRWRRRP